ncbi:uncharacterized protein CEXT_158891 [Caerostris extrusa]|uniref:Uncharacterized protein n=1 Tax=Caerostris extrusa TaxID=172846 RepID=A0AAV4MQX5_CAEEX|nr:uncharacterized protein CEXT_158891 [Caerostris extrusa]
MQFLQIVRSQKGSVLKKSLFELIITLLLLTHAINDALDVVDLLRYLPIGIVLSSFVTCFSSIVLRIALIAKHRLLLTTLEYLQDTIHNRNKNRYFNRLKLSVGFSLCFVIPVAYLIHTMHICFYGPERFLTVFVEDNCFG